MDPILVAADTALVGAMATDTWQQARAGAVALWRRLHPDRVVAIGSGWLAGPDRFRRRRALRLGGFTVAEEGTPGPIGSASDGVILSCT